MSDSDTLIPDANPAVRTDRLLDRYTRPSPPSRDRLEAEFDTEPHEDYGAFGWLRGHRERAIMLELRRKDGQIKAFGYAWLQLAEFEPSTGITLLFPAAKVRLVGRNLNTEARPHVRLFEGLTRHRVPFVQEADESSAMRAGPTDVLIERIEW
jgi:hypothetical protein